MFIYVEGNYNIITLLLLLHLTIEDEHHHKEKDKIDEDLHFSDGGSPEPNSNEVIIPMLKKNGPLLQSQ